MIFYYTGTGNSWRAAQQLAAATGDRHVVSIPRAIADGGYEYQIADGEPVGFVFPVYFYTLPSAVENFLHLLILDYTADPYVYGVITCGERIGNAGSVLADRLKKLGLRLNASFGLVMPNNSIPWYAADTGAQAEMMLKDADERLIKIGSAVQDREERREKDLCGPQPAFHTALAAGAYRKARRTARFSADDHCCGCGDCVRACPDRVIRLEQGRPVWSEDQCSLCLACMNICPTQSLCYDGTAGKGGQWFEPQYRSSLRD